MDIVEANDWMAQLVGDPAGGPRLAGATRSHDENPLEGD